ncbi:GAK6 protein, partial [Machaerirhynchus nigripectus]|nr:GAK6 protein [Machaerirhynchus nigripectus]
MAAAFAALKVAPGPTGQTCFGFGKLGHLKKACHALKGVRPKTPGVCPRCRKGQHYANQCQSKYDIYGKLISGNLNQSAGWRHTQTQIPQPNSAVGILQPYSQPPEAAQAWICQQPA